MFKLLFSLITFPFKAIDYIADQLLKTAFGIILLIIAGYILFFLLML